MGSTAPDGPFRRPWGWLIAITLAAVVAAFFVVENFRSRVAQSEMEFAAAQSGRLYAIDDRIHGYFSDAVLLTGLVAKLSDAYRGNEPALVGLLHRTFVARGDADVYGIGAFYAPYAFDARFRLHSIYMHGPPMRSDPNNHPAADGVDEVTASANAVPGGEDYTTYGWYRSVGRTTAGVQFAGPYTMDGRSFISVVRGFGSNGRMNGVASVDILTDRFKQRFLGSPADGDTVSIFDAAGARVLTVSSARPGGGDRIMRTTPIPLTRATLALSSDAGPLHDAQRTWLAATILTIIAIAGAAVLASVLVFSRARSAFANQTLRAEQTRLQAEVEFARAVEAQLRTVAYTDALTGLASRAALLEFAGDLLGAGRSGWFAFFIDLDHFNVVNETLGHVAGDELLRVIAARLRVATASGSLVARLGGDEFVVIAETNDPEAYAKQMLATIRDRVALSGQALYPHASVGVVPIDERYARPEEALRDADIALYAAKERGRNRYAFYDLAMSARIAEEAELERSLRRGLEEQQFLVHYQPIVDLRTREMAGFEALVRWQRDGALVGAGDFVGFAERRGLLPGIDAFVLGTALDQSRRLFAAFPEATLSINLSAAELNGANLSARVAAQLGEHGVDPSRIVLEITETAMMTYVDEVARELERLRDLGVTLSLDDFGTGYSSLARLARMPISALKIDRSFVAGIASDARSAEVVRSIVALAGTFGLGTTAEGVETAEQAAILLRLGVDRAQGFFFSPPLAVTEIAARTPDERRVVAKPTE